ncbi:kinase-like domain-containing protein [Gigaspora rosea]|uniref:Kinase-like domain-containing protein n=1 Tax=Gigaspora rosea TaxID=44941 RepID=A0A397TZD4_9GLOM|nr:kinase-like domain-containing protein [Gigaspora rosea]
MGNQHSDHRNDDLSYEKSGSPYTSDVAAKWGTCPECKGPNTGWNWCQKCNSNHFMRLFQSWTSNNEIIDEFIRDTQILATTHSHVFEWIPYKKFYQIKYITRGGFGKVYSASWRDGRIMSWDTGQRTWVQQYKPKHKVALKTIYNGMKITREFLSEIQIHSRYDDPSYIANWFGISQDPLSKEYIVVMKYFEHGSIRDYLRNNQINWLQKVKFIRQISFALSTIHGSGYCHRNLHTGNILVDNFPFARISDLGQGHLIDTRDDLVSEKKRIIFGVLPYIAPEVLRGQIYSKPADIYSFGVIICEILSEQPPFNDIAHDYQLAMRICKGDRPQIKQDVPPSIAKLIQLCWHSESNKRPAAERLVGILENALENDWKIPPELKDNDLKIADEIKEFLKSHGKDKLADFKLNVKDQNNNNHPEAIYISRDLDFPELSKEMDSYELTKYLTNMNIPLDIKMHPEITTAEYVKYFADINDNNKSNEIE